MSVPLWSALPAGVQGDKLNATLDGAPIVAERGISLWHPGYPTAAQLASLWPNADQWPGVRVGPMRTYWQGKAEQRPIKIMVQGDSNCVGQGATVGNAGCRDLSWPKLLATRLGWRDGCAWCMGIANADSRVTNNGWIALVKSALGAAWYTNSAGQDLDFAPGVPCDTIIVTGIATNEGGSSTVYVDGNVVGTLSHNTGINGGVDLPQITVPVTRGLHTIRVRANGGDCFVNTFETYDSQSTAPEFLHCGIADANMNELVAGNQRWEARYRLRMIRPSIVLFAATINDLDDGWAVEDITAGMTTARRNIRESGGEFIGVCGWATNRPNVTQASLDLLSAHLLTLSQDDGTAWIDNRAALGYTYATTNPALVADDWHLSAAGYAVMEDQIRRVFE